MKIGFTERGDAGLDLSWHDKLKTGRYDDAVLITKRITDKFIQKVMDLYGNGFTSIIVHCGCTGYGGSVIEPNVPPYRTQLSMLQKLIDAGFPKSHCVLRVDPIIPTGSCLSCTCEMIDQVIAMGLLPGMRIRISIMDEYRHVKERLIAAGYTPWYGTSFYASEGLKANVYLALTNRYRHGDPTTDLTFECCAEDDLAKLTGFKAQGCLSKTDLILMGLPMPDNTYENPQGRNGCHCLSCKTELLTNKKRCPHQCLYCYWRD